jgi:hypothetical protein
MNLAKGASVGVSEKYQFPAVLSEDGYPTRTPSTSIGGNFPVPAEYFGRYILTFSGTGSFELLIPGIVYKGGLYCNGIAPSNSGSQAFNTPRILGQTNPYVEFSFGALLSKVTSNGSGSVRITCSINNGFNNFPPTANVQINNLTGVATGVTYAATKIDSNNYDLPTILFNPGISIVAGGPGTQSEVIFSATQFSFDFPNSGAYGSGSKRMVDVIVCRKADIDGTNPFGLQKGYHVNADLIARYRQLNPAFIRFLDLSQVVNCTDTNWRYRRKTANFSWVTNYWVAAYWVGTINRGEVDAYNCVNPKASGAGAYVDGEIVQGQFDELNLTNTPTLNVSSRGAAPIYSLSANLMCAFFSGSAPSVGSVVPITFTGSYFPNGSYTLNYKVHSLDTNLDALQRNIASAINMDATLTANGIGIVNVGVHPLILYYNVNAGSGTTISSMPPLGLTILFGPQPVNAWSEKQNVSLTYSAVLKGWILSNIDTGGGLNSSAPIEVFCEVCNRVNCGYWANVPLLYANGSITAFATFIATYLNPSLRSIWEFSNEVWNFGQQQTNMAIALGSCLGFFKANAFISMYSFYALRLRQMAEDIVNAWTTSRPRSNVIIVCACWLLEGNGGGSGLNDNYRFRGAALTTSNATYAANGGPGGTAGTDYASFPNRPIDWCDGISYATYWQGKLVKTFSSDWTGIITPYISLLKASASYAAGGASNIANALAAWDNDVAAGDYAAYPSIYSGWEKMISAYDGHSSPNRGNSKLHVYCYEGGLQEGLGNSFSGTGDTRNDYTGYAPLLSQFDAERWDTSAFGSDNGIVAKNVTDLFIAYLNSNYFYHRIFLFYDQITSAHSARKAYPAQFGFEGPSIWSLFPGDIYTAPYQSFAALSAYNNVQSPN